VEIEKLALPAVSVAVPSAVTPSLNVTVPVGVPPPLIGLTEALSTTACPKVEGFGDEERVVCVGVLFTTKATGGEVLELKVVLPLYTATMV
jgi:hypothetical protein